MPEEVRSEFVHFRKPTMRCNPMKEFPTRIFLPTVDVRGYGDLADFPKAFF
jgi:hypothetical protein